MNSISFLIKPASSLCNLCCKYCFYVDEASHRSQQSTGIMSMETAEHLLHRAFEAAGHKAYVSFAFQGGEPMLAGLNFFQRFTDRARALCPPGVHLDFSIQTNGILLDADWIDFFRKEDYLVGISLDGDKTIHDANRVDAAGKGTWNRVCSTSALLRKHHVRENALCVITRECARHPVRVYENLKKLGFRYMQFIPCKDPLEEDRGGRLYSLAPEAYGKFLCSLFDLWYRDWERGCYHSIRLFDDYIHLLLGDSGSTCATCGRCGGYFVVESDGSVYPCDFYALDEWRMGSIQEQSLSSLSRSQNAQRFLDKDENMPLECESCQWKAVCNGGCKHDWVDTENGVHNYNCPAFRMLFQYAMPRMLRIAQAEQRLKQRPFL